MVTQWQNQNRLRMWPLDENASGIDNGGARFPENVVTELSFTVPAALASGIYVSAVAMTPALVSIVISSASGSLAVGTYTRPVASDPLPLTPVVPGVAGTVAFGDLVPEFAIHRFSGPDQSGLAASAVTVVPGTGIKTIQRHDDDARASGDVRVTGSGGVTVSGDGAGGLEIGLDRTSALELNRAQETVSRCASSPVLRLGGVTADSEGRILVRFL